MIDNTGLGKSVFSSITQLEELARKNELIEVPFVQKSLHSLSMRWNDLVASNLLTYLLNNADTSFLIDSAFELPGWGDLEGELMLGGVLGKEAIEFRHRTEKLPMHILVAGTSGSGKTNFAKVLIEELIRAGYSDNENKDK